MKDILLFVLYTLLVLGLIFCVLLVMDYVHKKKTKEAAEHQETATLDSRFTKSVEHTMLGGNARETKYYARFLLEDGTTQELEISAEQFSNWKEGDKGVLQSADGIVLSFTDEAKISLAKEEEI